MDAIILIAILFTICAISAASFAPDFGRSQANWFFIALLLGPLGLLLLFAIHNSGRETKAPPAGESSARQGASRLKRLLFGGLVAVLGALVLVLAAIEIDARFDESDRTLYLEQWERYGTGLLQAASTQDIPLDTFVVRVARDQVLIYRDTLYQELAGLDADLAQAVRGYRRAIGIEGVLVTFYRVITFRPSASQPVRYLSPRRQVVAIDRLTTRRSRYNTHIGTIAAAQRTWK